MPDDNSIPCSPPTLKDLARAAILDMFGAYLTENPDAVSNYLIALVDEHLFGPPPAPKTALEQYLDSTCVFCDAPPARGEKWCAEHDPAKNGHSAAALDRLDRDITTGDQLLAEVKEEIKAHTNGFQPSEDMSEIHGFPGADDLSETSDDALLDRAEQILQNMPAPPKERSGPEPGSVNEYILARPNVSVEKLLPEVTSVTGLSRNQADALIRSVRVNALIAEAAAQPVNSPSKPLDLTGGGNGSLSASEQEAKRREDGAWSVAKSAAKKAGKPLDEAEYRQRYRDRRAAAAGGAR